MSDLTVLFDHPFSEGSSASLTAGPVPPDRVVLAGKTFLVDIASGLWTRESKATIQQRNTSSQRDVLLLPQDVWRQSSESWHFGAGQTNIDRDDSLPYRYARSFGVDPWTKYQLSLLSETTWVGDGSGLVDEPTFLQVHEGLLCVVCGGKAIWFADAVSDLGTVQTLAGSPGDAISVTYDGEAVIVLTDAGKVVRLTSPTTQSTDATTYAGATFIAYVKDFLVIGVANKLRNITGTPVDIFTHPTTDFRWFGAAEGDSAIYVGGGLGERSVVHRVGISDDGTTLTPAIVAATLPDGEAAVSIGSYLGFVFIGTEKGIRMAAASTSGDLTLGALLPTLEPVLAFEGQGRFVWAGASSLDAQPETGDMPEMAPDLVSGLVRLDLTTFTVTSVTPAYAPDISTWNSGHGVVTSVVTWLGKPTFAVQNVGVYTEAGYPVPCGWLEQGVVAYSVEDKKTALYAQLRWEMPLHGRVALDLAYDDAEPERVTTWALSDVRPENTNLGGRQFGRVEPRIVLYASTEEDPVAGPVVTRLEMRARPTPGKNSRWQIPLMVESNPEFSSGENAQRDVNEDYAFLLGLVESGTMFALQEANRTNFVTAVDYKWSAQRLTEMGDGWQGIFLLAVEEVR